MAEMLDVIGNYGFPTVAAGIMMILYIRSQRREEERSVRLEQQNTELNEMLRGRNGNGGGALQRIEEALIEEAARTTQLEALIHEHLARTEPPPWCEERLRAIEVQLGIMSPTLGD